MTAQDYQRTKAVAEELRTEIAKRPGKRFSDEFVEARSLLNKAEVQMMLFEIFERLKK